MLNTAFSHPQKDLQPPGGSGGFLKSVPNAIIPFFHTERGKGS